MIAMLLVLNLVLSVLLVVGVLLHRGSGGGLSEMLGGGATDAARSSAVAAKNLTRFTAAIALLWIADVIVLGLHFSRAAGA